jgi:hypothetical protein
MKRWIIIATVVVAAAASFSSAEPAAGGAGPCTVPSKAHRRRPWRWEHRSRAGDLREVEDPGLSPRCTSPWATRSARAIH